MEPLPRPTDAKLVERLVDDESHHDADEEPRHRSHRENESETLVKKDSSATLSRPPLKLPQTCSEKLMRRTFSICGFMMNGATSPPRVRL